MGLITEELNQKVVPACAMLQVNPPLLSNGSGLSSPSGPVVGLTVIPTDNMTEQMHQIANALTAVAMAVRKLEESNQKLEERLKRFETANPNMGRPLPTPPPLRR